MNSAKWSREAVLLASWLPLIIGAACSSPAPPSTTIPVVNVQASSAASPWLEGFYTCGGTSTAVRLSDPESAEIEVRLGEPADLSTPAFQIGEADIVVVVHPQNGVGALTLPQVQEIFAGEFTNWKELGGSDQQVQVWTYSPGEDVQAYFNRAVMQGRPISSLARLAVSAQAMSDDVGGGPGAIGFLPKRWMAGNTREALLLPKLPVLAITPSEPTGFTKQLLGCVQSYSGASR